MSTLKMCTTEKRTVKCSPTLDCILLVVLQNVSSFWLLFFTYLGVASFVFKNSSPDSNSQEKYTCISFPLAQLIVADGLQTAWILLEKNPRLRDLLPCWQAAFTDWRAQSFVSPPPYKKTKEGVPLFHGYSMYQTLSLFSPSLSLSPKALTISSAWVGLFWCPWPSFMYPSQLFTSACMCMLGMEIKV